MSDGPTTVGSIVGKVGLDRTEWLREVAATKEDAAELGRLRPTVKADANVGEAIAKLTATAEAADAVARSDVRLTAATQAVTTAQNRLSQATTAAQIAYLRLDEVQSKGNATQRQLLAAHLAAEKAEEQQTNATLRLTAAQKALEEQTESLIVKKGALATVQDRVNQSTITANEANKTSATRVGMIATAVALLLPLLPALGSFAVAGAGSLTFMGVSGVLAILGIKNAMEQGNATGAAYSTGLASLRGNLNALSQTSALAMLGSFQSVVRTTNGEMPLLNRNVQTFSTILGRSGAALFDGAVTSLRVMEPLLIRTGVWVQNLATGFQSWTSNGGLQKFTNYALGQLPSVLAVLSALGNTILHVLQALAPLGTIGMAVLTVLSQAISAIPVETLSVLIGAVTWGAIAFKAWGFIAPMLSTITTAMGAMGVATTIATGPIGWIAAGVAALAAIFAVVSINSQNAAASQQQYTAAVQADTGAIGDNVKATAAKALQDAGAYDASQRLGVSSKLLTDATLGNTSAQRQLEAQLSRIESQAVGTATKMQDLTNEQQGQVGDVEALRDAYTGQNESITAAVALFNQYQEATGGVTITTVAQQRALEAEAAALGITVSALLSAKSGQQDTQFQTDKTTASMYLQNDAAGLLKQSLDALNGKAISYAQAQNQYDSALARITDTTITLTDANGNQTQGLDEARASLDANTESGTAARGELINLVTASQNAAQSFRDQGGSADETAAKMAGMKQQIIDNAVANGLNRDAVTQFIDQLYQIPASIPPTKVEADTSSAQASIDRFLANNANHKITIATGAGGTGGLVPGARDGGTIGGMSTGGTVRGPGSAEHDSAGVYALANTEEVISNRLGQADRWRPLLKAINQNKSADTIAGYVRGNGGGSAVSATSYDQSRTIHAPITVQGAYNPTATAADVQRRLQRLAV